MIKKTETSRWHRRFHPCPSRAGVDDLNGATECPRHALELIIVGNGNRRDTLGIRGKPPGHCPNRRPHLFPRFCNAGSICFPHIPNKLSTEPIDGSEAVLITTSPTVRFADPPVHVVEIGRMIP